MIKYQYFPHDYHARHDPKLERLRIKYGAVTDGVYWCIVEMLYEQGGYMPVSDIPIIAKLLHTDEKIVDEVVTHSKLFSFFEDAFFSESQIKRLKHIEKRCEKARKSINKRWNTNVLRTNYEGKDSKVKYSIVKESKEKNKDNVLGAKAPHLAKEATNEQQKDTNLPLVIKYIYDTRLKKTGNKYIISGKIAKRLKDLCRVYTHAEVCAGWSIFINDKLDEKERAFWCKGYLPDSFVTQQCFSLCQESPDYKTQVRRHEVETFSYKPIEIKCELKSI